MDIKKYKAFINEDELPYFSNFDKEILQYGLDNIENIREGDDPYEAADQLFSDPEGLVIYHHDGINLLSNFNHRDRGDGWANALAYVFEKSDELGDFDYVGDRIKEGNWAAIANYLINEYGKELILASDILAQAISVDKPLTVEDIEDLGDELQLFIDG